MQKLPKLLMREPLVEAVFEVRLNGTPTLADILPGFLFHELEPKPTVKRLPAAEIPQPMRANDPGLRFAPVLRLEWGNYFISVGDRNFVISCKLPYPKWPNFEAAILDITGRIAKVGITGKVERYSLKYVNLIQAPKLAEQISKIKMSITLGPVEVSGDHVHLRVHRKDEDIVHILSVLIGAVGKLPDGKEVSGAVVDIDSIRNVNLTDFSTFAADLKPGLRQLRQANKMMFFGCLTDAAIEEMGPVYE
jgi:uncharacterized protein (TIGR04255 family)